MIAISACLAGEKCRYDGKDKARVDLVDLVSSGKAIALCPEEMGGLSTPRDPAEIQADGKILSNKGEDVSSFYQRGAELALDLCKKNQVEKVILKSCSPMCGVDKIYDGSFKGDLIKGDGVFAKLLKEHQIKVESRD